MTPAEHSLDMARRLPHSVLEILPDSGHMMILEHYEQVNHQLRALVGRVRAGLAGSAGCAGRSRRHDRVGPGRRLAGAGRGRRPDARPRPRRRAALLRAGDLVVLDGPLGAGKTTFMQGVGRGAGRPRAGDQPDVRHRPAASGAPGSTLRARGRLPPGHGAGDRRPGPGRGRRRTASPSSSGARARSRRSASRGWTSHRPDGCRSSATIRAGAPGQPAAEAEAPIRQPVCARSSCVLWGLAGRVCVPARARAAALTAGRRAARARLGPCWCWPSTPPPRPSVAAVLRRSDARERNGGPASADRGPGTGERSRPHGARGAGRGRRRAGPDRCRGHRADARRRRGRAGPRTLHRTARRPGVRRDAGLVAGHPRARRLHARRAGRRGAGRGAGRSCSSRPTPGAARSTGRATPPTVAGSRARRSAPPCDVPDRELPAVGAGALRYPEAFPSPRHPVRSGRRRSWPGSWPTPSRAGDAAGRHPDVPAAPRCGACSARKPVTPR